MLERLWEFVSGAFVMKSGEMLDYGTSEQIMNQEKVRKYYLGENFHF